MLAKAAALVCSVSTLNGATASAVGSSDSASNAELNERGSDNSVLASTATSTSVVANSAGSTTSSTSTSVLGTSAGVMLAKSISVAGAIESSMPGTAGVISSLDSEVAASSPVKSPN